MDCSCQKREEIVESGLLVRLEGLWGEDPIEIMVKACHFKA
jgi:hypothetical protein